MSSVELNADCATRLLELARESIAYGLHHRTPLTVQEGHYPKPLQRPAASFVTLTREARLRGCVGTLEPYRALVADVMGNSFAAAFQDPRFAPLSHLELDTLEISLSILNAPEPLACQSEAELVERLRPGIDGLTLKAGIGQATFLPTVWESVASPVEFVRLLKRKAGFAKTWPEDLEAYRYTIQHIA